MIRHLLSVLILAVCCLGFTSGSLTAQTTATCKGDIDSYTVNADGHVTQFVVKKNGGGTETIVVSAPNQSLTEVILDAAQNQAHRTVTVTYNVGNPQTFVSMTVQID